MNTKEQQHYQVALDLIQHSINGFNKIAVGTDMPKILEDGLIRLKLPLVEFGEEMPINTDEIKQTKKELLDCIRNLMSLVDTPLGMRQIKGDFAEEVRIEARKIMENNNRLPPITEHREVVGTRTEIKS